MIIILPPFRLRLRPAEDPSRPVGLYICYMFYGTPTKLLPSCNPPRGFGGRFIVYGDLNYAWFARPIWSLFIDRLWRSTSTNFGLKPLLITAIISDGQVKGGTITSPFFFKFFKAAKEIKFAADPELTKTEYFTPSHLDHFFSNSYTGFWRTVALLIKLAPFLIIIRDPLSFFAGFCRYSCFTRLKYGKTSQKRSKIFATNKV